MPFAVKYLFICASVLTKSGPQLLFNHKLNKVSIRPAVGWFLPIDWFWSPISKNAGDSIRSVNGHYPFVEFRQCFTRTIEHGNIKTSANRWGLQWGVKFQVFLVLFFHPRFVGWVSDATMNSIINPDFTARLPTIHPEEIKIEWKKNKPRNVFIFNAPDTPQKTKICSRGYPFLYQILVVVMVYPFLYQILVVFFCSSLNRQAQCNNQ